MRGSFKAICSGFNVRSSGWGYREKCERKDAPGANCNRKTPKGNKCATLQWNKHLWCHKTNQARIFLTHLKTNTCESASFCVSVCLLLCKSIFVLVLVLRPSSFSSCSWSACVWLHGQNFVCVLCLTTAFGAGKIRLSSENWELRVVGPWGWDKVKHKLAQIKFD